MRESERGGERERGRERERARERERERESERERGRGGKKSANFAIRYDKILDE